MRKLIFAAIVICNMWAAPASACQKCFDTLLGSYQGVDKGIENCMKDPKILAGMTRGQIEIYGEGLKYGIKFAIEQINEIHPETNLSLSEWVKIFEEKNKGIKKGE